MGFDSILALLRPHRWSFPLFPFPLRAASLVRIARSPLTVWALLTLHPLVFRRLRSIACTHRVAGGGIMLMVVDAVTILLNRIFSGPTITA